MTAFFDRACAQRLFDALAAHWVERPDYKGVYRPGYSRQETAAIAMLLQEAARIGMPCYADLAGNVYMVMAGKNPDAKVILTGSHLDGVPQGGLYDGPAGIVGALAMCSAFAKAKMVPPQDIVVMIIRAEESPWFGQASIGSKLAVGNFPVEKLKMLHHRDDGRLLSEHMDQCGVHAGKLQHCGVLLPMEQVAAFVELHIEQGPVLHQQQVPVGVVTSNRGSLRIPSIVIRGEGGHTGTVPMAMRRDAVRAAARFISRFEDGCNALIAEGHDVVFTIPLIGMEDASPTTIPAECHFYLEARSNSTQVQSLLLDMIGGIQFAIEQEYSVKIALSNPVISKPAMMDEGLQQQLQQSANKQGIAWRPVAGGAGHDAAVLCNAGLPAAMLFIRHEGKSHRHDEGMSLDDLQAAVQVLAQFCMDGVHADAITGARFVDVLIQREAEPIMMQEYATTSPDA